MFTYCEQLLNSALPAVLSAALGATAAPAAQASAAATAGAAATASAAKAPADLATDVLCSVIASLVAAAARGAGGAQPSASSSATAVAALPVQQLLAVADGGPAVAALLQALQLQLQEHVSGCLQAQAAADVSEGSPSSPPLLLRVEELLSRLSQAACPACPQLGESLAACVAACVVRSMAEEGGAGGGAREGGAAVAAAHCSPAGSRLLSALLKEFGAAVAAGG